MAHITLKGAYGREATWQDWIDGKDFQIYDGPYCSIRDVAFMAARGICYLNIRKHNGDLVRSIDLRTVPK